MKAFLIKRRTEDYARLFSLKERSKELSTDTSHFGVMMRKSIRDTIYSEARRLFRKYKYKPTKGAKDDVVLKEFKEFLGIGSIEQQAQGGC